MQRRGWATSEFWTALAVGVGSLAAALEGALPPRYAAIAAAVAVAAYNVARGLAKLGPVPTAPAGPQAAAPSGPVPDNGDTLATVTAPPVGEE